MEPAATLFQEYSPHHEPPHAADVLLHQAVAQALPEPQGADALWRRTDTDLDREQRCNHLQRTATEPSESTKKKHVSPWKWNTALQELFWQCLGQRLGVVWAFQSCTGLLCVDLWTLPSQRSLGWGLAREPSYPRAAPGMTSPTAKQKGKPRKESRCKTSLFVSMQRNRLWAKTFQHRNTKEPAMEEISGTWSGLGPRLPIGCMWSIAGFAPGWKPWALGVAVVVGKRNLIYRSRM